MKKLIFIIITALTTACSQTSTTKDTGNYIMKGDTIIIPDKSILKEKLKIETVKSQPYQFKLTTTGIVKAIPNKYAQVASPFAGRIVKSYVKLGQHVSINSPIFEISSPSYFEAGKAYYQAKQEMLLAEKNLTHLAGFLIKSKKFWPKIRIFDSKNEYFSCLHFTSV